MKYNNLTKKIILTIGSMVSYKLTEILIFGRDYLSYIDGSSLLSVIFFQILSMLLIGGLSFLIIESVSGKLDAFILIAPIYIFSKELWNNILSPTFSGTGYVGTNPLLIFVQILFLSLFVGLQFGIAWRWIVDNYKRLTRGF